MTKADYITALNDPDNSYEDLNNLVEQAAYDSNISITEYFEIYNESLAVFRSWRGF